MRSVLETQDRSTFVLTFLYKLSFTEFIKSIHQPSLIQEKLYQTPSGHLVPK